MMFHEVMLSGSAEMKESGQCLSEWVHDWIDLMCYLEVCMSHWN